MDFRSNKTLEKKSIYLEPCSMVLLRGQVHYFLEKMGSFEQSRYSWTHGIAGREFDEVGRKEVKRSRRISVTFRLMIPAYLEAAKKKINN